MTALSPGASVGTGYEVSRLVLTTATACHYEAVRTSDGAKVGLAVAHPHVGRDHELSSAFRADAYAANAIPSAEVVRTLDDGTTSDGRPFLVTEHVEGEPLVALRRAWGGKLPLDVAVDFVAQLLGVLAAAHDIGLVHPELRPENVVIGPGGRIKVTGFGRVTPRATPGLDAELARLGYVLPAPAYMAPEEAIGDPLLVDAQTDIFCAGAILFWLIAGRGPYDANEGPRPFSELLAATKTKPRSLRAAVPSDVAPDAIVELVDRALSQRKSERWLDARAFAEALAQATSEGLGGAHPGDDDPGDDEPTWNSGPELEPELLAHLKAAQGIETRKSKRPSAAPILADDDAVDPTIPVPAAVIEAAREAGLTVPGQAPVPHKRTMRMRAPGAPEPAVAGEPPPPKPAPAPPEPALVPMFPPRRGPEVPRDEASIIVNATPVPPPAAPPAPAPQAPHSPVAPQAMPHAFGPSPTPFGAITPASAQSSGAYGALGHAPPPRSRKDDATVMLAPARREEPSSGKGWIVVVVVVVVVLVLAAAGGALVFLRG